MMKHRIKRLRYLSAKKNFCSYRKWVLFEQRRNFFLDVHFFNYYKLQERERILVYVTCNNEG